MKRIAIEEHFFTEGYLNFLRSRNEYPRLQTFEDEKNNKVERMWRSPLNYTIQRPERLNALTDLGSGRIAGMDKFGLDVQVLSLASPGVDDLDFNSGTLMAKKVNDDLAQAIRLYPNRLVGLAAIAPGNPAEAAKELERAVKELGLKGAKINSYGRGEYLDNRKYWIIFEKAAELGVPIYLHPKEPPQDILTQYMPYQVLSTAVWGFGADAGLHSMRLISSGLFDAYPGLKIILGHLGEAIPFWLWRIDNHWQKSSFSKNLKKKPSDYFNDNFYVTTSGMFGYQSFLSTYLTLGADKILFAVDSPYESNEEAVKFMDAVAISETDKEKIYHLNAERLFTL